MRQRFGGKELLAWCAALLLAGLTLGSRDYRTRDADSLLYSAIAADLSTRPFDGWIAPAWPAGSYGHGLFREHPAGIFVLPALLARIGFPADQAAYAVNALYQVLTILLLCRVAAFFVAEKEARALAWMTQLLPIAFTYRIRANHEQALLACLLVALYATERSRHRPRWAVVTALAFVWMALVKGVLAALGPPACAAWLLARGRSSQPTRPSGPAAWRGLALAASSLLPLAAVYEGLYQQATRESFLVQYLGRQMGDASAHSTGLLSRTAYNFLWYAARLVWFAFPWSLPALAAAWHRKRALLRLARNEPEVTAEREEAREGLAFALGLSVLYLALFSLTDRKTDRYVFPAYYLVGACGAVAALRRWPRLRRVADRLDRLHPLVPVGVFLSTFVLHLFGGRLGLPRIKIWTS